MLFKKQKRQEIRIYDNPNKTFEVRPFEQLTGQLLYASFKEIYSENNVNIFIREYKQFVCKVYLISTNKNFNEEFVSNDFLINNTKSSEFDLSILDKTNQATVYIFKEYGDESKKMIHRLSNHTLNTYNMGLMYNEKELLLEEYVGLPKNKKSMLAYLDLLIVLLGCKDPDEMEE